MNQTTIDIPGNGDDWTELDHALHDAMLVAGAVEDVYDQEQDGSCHTFLTLPADRITPALREMIIDAPNAGYAKLPA
jgi:hypothetical protein